MARLVVFLIVLFVFLNWANSIDVSAGGTAIFALLGLFVLIVFATMARGFARMGDEDARRLRQGKPPKYGPPPPWWGK